MDQGELRSPALAPFHNTDMSRRSQVEPAIAFNPGYNPGFTNGYNPAYQK